MNLGLLPREEDRGKGGGKEGEGRTTGQTWLVQMQEDESSCLEITVAVHKI